MDDVKRYQYAHHVTSWRRNIILASAYIISVASGVRRSVEVIGDIKHQLEQWHTGYGRYRRKGMAAARPTGNR